MSDLIISVPGLWAFFTLLSIGGMFLLLFSEDTYKKATGAVSIIFFFVFVGLWYHSATHIVIPINQKALVIDKNSQTIDGDVRSSGVVSIPLLGSKVLYFPDIVAYRPCEEEHPAIAASIAIKITVCYSSDATKIDWKIEYLRQGEENLDAMFAKWHLLRSKAVSQALGVVTTADLTIDITNVGKKIYDQVATTFKNEGFPLNEVIIQFWDFENSEAGKVIDTKTADARADQEKAKIEQQTQMIRVKTANDVLAAQTQAIKQSLDQLGIVDSQSRAKVFQMQILLGVLPSLQNVTVIVNPGGADAASPVLAQPKQDSSATATPQPNKQ